MRPQGGTADAAARAHALWEGVFCVLAAACVFPLLYVRYPPIQDLPQHLAAVRVLHDFRDPGLGFAAFYELDLWRTQYLAYYLAAHLLSYVVGVEPACKLLIAASLIATPYAARSLLQALGKDGRLALLTLPLAYNAHLVLGFLNFIAAIPLSLYAVALAVRQRRQHTLARAVGLAILAIVCFYTHVVPFALLVLGVGLVALGRDLRSTGRALLPLVPSALAALLWLRHSPAGNATLDAARGDADGPTPYHQPYAIALQETPRWLTDVLRDGTGRDLLLGWTLLIGLLLLLAAVGLALRWKRAEPPPAMPDLLARSLARRLALLPPLCAALYFLLPSSYDWIWPINARFPLLALIFMIIVLPGPRGPLRLGLLSAVSLVAALSFAEIATAFRKFEREEVGELEQALAAIPPGQKVAGLVWQRSSRYVKFSPFIHAVAWYQAKKGGAVMFTFADFPQSPFKFRSSNRPPRVPARWEWEPARVDPLRELEWFDYVLTRGDPGRIAQHTYIYEPVFQGPLWAVWKRRR